MISRVDKVFEELIEQAPAMQKEMLKDAQSLVIEAIREGMKEMLANRQQVNCDKRINEKM